MAYDRDTVRTLYRKLLSDYPRNFRGEFRESMEQTFNDLSNERKRETDRSYFSFVLWIFIETFIGITKEYVLLITQGYAMKNILTTLRSPAIISLLLVVPFAVLELVNRRQFNEGFPFVLFALLWLLPLVFIVTLMPVVRNVRAGNGLIAKPIGLLIRVVILVFIAWMWFGIVIDQMPCFLGVPNCD